MTGLFPDDMPWLSADEKYLNGVEVGALLMLTQLGAPLIKMKVHGENEDQIRVGAAFAGYHVCVDSRDDEWTFLTLAVKGTEVTSDD